MDYKIIIILIALLFLMILIYREVNELKDQWNKNMSDMSVYLNQNNEKMLKNVQTHMNKYVAQIKSIGNDNLQQLGKITLLNHQPIIERKTANHFTETDLSNYMSDKVGIIEEENEKIFEKKENSHYYMSEDTKKHSDKKEKSIETGENAPYSNSDKNKSDMSCENGVCKINKDEKKPRDDTDIMIPIYIPPEKDIIPIYQQQKTIEQKPIKDVENQQLNKNIISQINKSTNTLETSMIEEDDYDVSDGNNTKKTNDNEIEIDVYDIINNSDLNKIMENNENMYIDEDDRHIDHEEKSVEMISSDTVNIEKNISKIDLTNSVNKILNDNTEQQPLKNIDNYDAQSLREMAKKMGIPTTYKEKNKVKQYKKQELYNNILSHLKNKSHQL